MESIYKLQGRAEEIAARYYEVLDEFEGLMEENGGELNEESQEMLDKLAEIEHIRWCRYHYLNNWSYGMPDNGKTKDAQRRIHSSLRPYPVLPPQEQEKDRENVRLLRELQAAE